MKTLDVLATILIVVGGLNWGLWGIFQFDLVAAIFGGNTAVLSRIVYTLVGVAAAYRALGWASVQQRLSPAKS
jgi:uncharacterized membrane protein YuzA (DUF378 family)